MEQALAVVLIERNRFGGSSELDRVQLNLLHLAGGSIQQEVDFADSPSPFPLGPNSIHLPSPLNP